MNKQVKIAATLLAPAALALALQASAAIPGIGRVAGDSSCAGTTCTFNLTASTGQITLGDGNQLLAWGYGVTGESMQYPGPTLIVKEGDSVTVNLTNTLRLPASIVFPGQAGVVATGGVAGLLTNEAAAAGGTVSYSFTVSRPGTYLYQSGTQPDIEIEMGLVGTLIVRPAGFNEATNAGRTAYGAASSAYDREYLFFESEMDRCAHAAEDAIEQALAAGQPLPDPADHNPPDVCTTVDPATFMATLWFLNGRNGPDTMLKANVSWLPLQPYNALARMHPGERALMRLVDGGRDLHPFHHHGNNAWLIARDGRLLESAPGADAAYPDFQNTSPLTQPIPELVAKNARLPDQAISNYTIQTLPGSTYDAIFTWTGKGLNWDAYGHAGADCDTPAHTAASRQVNEEPAPGSHCRPFPVTLPEQQALTFGGMWSGSPFLQSLEPLPPLQGGLNPGGGFTFMWHSHTEKELANDDIFPGGMMTMMIIEGPDVPIDADGNID
jgi:FtsP/CotA-like multicopper oxidase with cupredoxin domain